MRAREGRAETRLSVGLVGRTARDGTKYAGSSRRSSWRQREREHQEQGQGQHNREYNGLGESVL